MVEKLTDLKVITSYFFRFNNDTGDVLCREREEPFGLYSSSGNMGRGEGEEVVMRRRPAPGRGVTAVGRRGGIVSYTDFGPIDLPPQRSGFLRPRPVLDSQGRIGERWVDEGRGVEGKKGDREERRLEGKEGRVREPSSGPFLRNERGFSGLQQRRSECH